jgi:hypothetical protein
LGRPSFSQEKAASLHRQLAPVLREVALVPAPLPFFQRDRVDLVEFPGIGIDVLRDPPVQDFLTGPAVNALRRLVPGEDASFQILHHDGVLRLVEEGSLFLDLPAHLA